MAAKQHRRLPAHSRTFALVLAAIFLLAFLGAVSACPPTTPEGKPTIGIDLGTTYSCVAVVRDGRVEVIPNEQGGRLTPSYVSFYGDEILIGEAAKNLASTNPRNTIFDVKRLMGRHFNDTQLQADLKHLPYKVVDQNGWPAVEVTFKGQLRSYTPEVISAMILGRMKEMAATYLGQEVNDAIITVPAYFTDAQRKATRDAGGIAGLSIRRIINEPTSAAIAYGVNKADTPNSSETLVFDFGGGTLDVTILSVEDGVFEVIATSGDPHLGGEDFDNRLVDHLRRRFEERTGVGGKCNDNPSFYSKLKRATELAKHALSSEHSMRVEIDDLCAGEGLREVVTRVEFEEMNKDLFLRAMEPVERALADSKLGKKGIHRVVLVGGSTRIPKVVAMIEEMLGRKATLGINVDEAVASGAAVLGAMLKFNPEYKNISILDLTPISLGLETEGGNMSTIVARNTLIPTKRTQTFTTASDNQRVVKIRVYQGEKPLVKDNELLGEFELQGISPAPRGTPQIDVTFEIDANGILVVSAKDAATGQSSSLTVTQTERDRDVDGMKRIMRDVETHRDDDEAARGTLGRRGERGHEKKIEEPVVVRDVHLHREEL
ncbi:ATPase with role in protein import into the ER [Irineochytrium annulatum]|nr:ATPase with role in protein import into the ER [Irineochytrium annulatum]